MRVDIDFKENKKTKQMINDMPDQVMRRVARITLDMTEPLIPKDTHKMAISTMNYGVRGSNADYYIGSPTAYASSVYVMPDNTNWTTPNTNNKWFHRTYKKNQKIIIDKAISETLRVMKK